ncbi:MAG: NAD(P)-dependent alcohol dehydrogenase [Chlorobium sp.]|nr:NAD(P)-dependent alcohol dehydrogenase [Chlorobium sp.]MCW8818724.1 NAD(P)-dependent alcohol dehydrogenase [Ignavibacteriaceae bacterium]
MRAAYFENYGSVEHLMIKDQPVPEPEEHEVLVRNHASSLNFGNVGHVKGEPFFIRAFSGLNSPKKHVPGGDVSGVIEKVGKQVTGFKPGDEVMGDAADSGFGAFAEYVTVNSKVIVPKPVNLSYEKTATLPLAACTALSGLKKGNIQPGQNVLIVGSTGSVGPFAVQIAKSFGAEVTAVCSGKKAGFVRSMGADHIIDYTTEDFRDNDNAYDLVLGIAGTHSMSDFKKKLTPTGTYVNIGGSMKQFSNAFTTGPLLYLFSRQKFSILMYMADQKTLQEVKKMAEEGTIKPTITKTFSLDQISDAYSYYESGHAAGKIVITM